MFLIRVFLIVAATVFIIMAQSNSISITVRDADGNVYSTIKIGNQVWTVENLRTTKFNDGTAIPLVTDAREWWYTKGIVGYCWYNNDINNKNEYGALYNWNAVNTKKLAPAGWHVPTKADWDALQNYLITNGYNWDGTASGNKIAKSLAAKANWDNGDYWLMGYKSDGSVGNRPTRNNKSGFSALPGGDRQTVFELFEFAATWWSSTECNSISAYSSNLFIDSESLTVSTSGKAMGCSVRLVRD